MGPDPRFHELIGPVSASALAAACGATLSDPTQGDEPVATLGPLDAAGVDALAFFEPPGAQSAEPVATSAGFVLARAADVARLPAQACVLVSSTPRAAFARAARLLVRLREFEPGAPSVHPSARLEDGVQVMPGAVIGPDARIGAGTVIGPNAVMGPGCAVGRDCRIGAGVSIACALIGDGVTIGANAAIGHAGFGVAGDARGLVDLPQIGRVIIQNDVSIGALTAVDRGAFGDTVIGEGSKIDNLVQIAHNCRLDRNVIMAGSAGLAGSVTIGEGAIIAGMVGVADHATIGAGATLAGHSGVFGAVPPGETWGGYPARPIRQWLRETAMLARQTKGRDKRPKE